MRMLGTREFQVAGERRATAAHDDWKIDITFWLTDGPREQRARALALTRLPRETRICLLWLKDVWHLFRHTHMKLAAPTSTTLCLSTASAPLMSRRVPAAARPTSA